MDRENILTNELIFPEDPPTVLKEIKTVISRCTVDFKTDLFERSFNDTKRLFDGEYPGYRGCNTKYHNLHHTISVALAAARLIHGGCLEGEKFSPNNILLTLVAALFHDAGLIQAMDDVEGSGAKYTIGHEERSIDFMKQYLSKEGFTDRDLDNCTHLINCTILNMSPDVIPFDSHEIETLGKIVGSADLLAQIADRNYLEKLFLLYAEFEEGKLPGFNSELELLQKTGEFYEYIAKNRLSDELGNVRAFMRTHFRDRWSVDRDFYYESISKNIEYIKALAVKCEESIECYLENLRRGGITDKINDPSEE